MNEIIQYTRTFCTINLKKVSKFINSEVIHT